jgi:fatty-acyl-CoA synthase
MFLGTHAERTPDKPALIIAETGEMATYAQVNDNALKIAQFLSVAGLKRGDTIAILMENHINYMDVIWAALRSGYYVTTINRYATADDVAYVLKDSQCRALFVSQALRQTVLAIPNLQDICPNRVMVGRAPQGWLDYGDILTAFQATPLPDVGAGATMMYTSGTTGRPKGVMRALPDQSIKAEWDFLPLMAPAFDLSQDMVLYMPAPMYHGGPMLFLRAAHSLGATIVQTRKFDALRTLQDIETYQITHSFMVPTMFVRMLKLPEADRTAYDLSSLRSIVHSAAPCPREIKEAMIDWWGPIIHEFYGATDGGLLPIRCEDWLRRPGAAALAAPDRVRICAEDGTEMPAGEEGLIYFVSKGAPAQYRNDPDKTRAARHPVHDTWVSAGDVGYVDADGFLFLTDRKAHTIISGGVNIYPQIIENALVLHPAVADAAVFGVPNQDMGEEVKAVVELVEGQQPGADLAQQIQDFLTQKIAAYMLPRSLDFSEALPRTASGKLMKRELRAAYWT